MTCSVEGCDTVVYARGWCGRHYKQVRRTGDVQPDPAAPGPCAAEGCTRQAVTRGWCHGHYQRWHRTGDAHVQMPLRRPDLGCCTVDGCLRPAHARSLCRAHLNRWRQTGDVAADRPVREVTRQGSISHGYWKVPVPSDLRHLVVGANHTLEHRLVMAQKLGRPLTPDESVHHRNGDRLDNRPENLELWSCMQPAGQRVRDKITFAITLLQRYAPELLDMKKAPVRQDEDLSEACVPPSGFEPPLPP